MPDVTAPKSVLIAGGAGYIGSHTAKVLSRAGMMPESAWQPLRRE